MKMISPGNMRLSLALVLALALAACASDKAAAPRTGESVIATVLSPAKAMPAFTELAVRVENEDYNSALVLKAIAHAALQARGIRSADALAAMTLTLALRRPRRASTESRPNFGIEGRGGSSSRANVGLSISIPIFGSEDEAKPEPHIMSARLEQTRPSEILWRAEARTEAIASDVIDAAVARRLIDALVDKLAAARR